MQSYNVFFVLHLNKLLNKQSNYQWLEMSQAPFYRWYFELFVCEKIESLSFKVHWNLSDSQWACIGSGNGMALTWQKRITQTNTDTNTCHQVWVKSVKIMWKLLAESCFIPHLLTYIHRNDNKKIWFSFSSKYASARYSNTVIFTLIDSSRPCILGSISQRFYEFIIQIF